MKFVWDLSLYDIAYCESKSNDINCIYFEIYLENYLEPLKN